MYLGFLRFKIEFWGYISVSQYSPSSPSSCQAWLFLLFQDKFMCPHGREGREPRSKCGSLSCYRFSLASLEIHQSKFATGSLWICCSSLSLVKPVFYPFRVVGACSPLFLTCSLSTSQQHCRSLCLSHVCSAASSRASSHSDPNGISLSATTFHIPSWDRDGTPGHKSPLHKSQGSLRPAVTEPSLASSHCAAI